MTDLPVMIIGGDRLRRKSHPVDSPPDILEKIKFLTLADNVADALVGKTVNR